MRRLQRFPVPPARSLVTPAWSPAPPAPTLAARACSRGACRAWCCVAALAAARASACEAALAAAPPSGVEKGVRERAREREIQESKRERELGFVLSQRKREGEVTIWGKKNRVRLYL